MGGHYGEAHEEVIARGLAPVVYDVGQIEGFARLVRAGDVSGPIDVHLKIDTGMARLGVTHGDAARVRGRARATPRGARARADDAPGVRRRADERRRRPSRCVRFDEATALLARHGVRADVRHAANSAALLRGAGAASTPSARASRSSASRRASAGDGAALARTSSP